MVIEFNFVESDAQRRLKQIEIYISCNYKRDISIEVSKHYSILP